MIFQVPVEQAAIQPDILFSIGNLAITNAMLLGVVVTLFFALLAIATKVRVKMIPSKIQTVLEMTVDSFLTLLEQITGNRKAAESLLPLVGAIFLYFGLSNIVGLIPGVTSLTYNGVPMFRTPTNDFNMTFSVALAVVIITHVASLKAFGLFGHLGKFFKFKDVVKGFKEGIGPGILSIIDFLIGLLDIISEVAKVVSLSLRLFGNMYAGEVLAAILLGSFALFIPAPWLAMNLLVGILQALVFGALTAAYYALAVQKEEELA
jgi:F-type H+-transporting ATPase subunit a